MFPGDNISVILILRRLRGNSLICANCLACGTCKFTLVAFHIYSDVRGNNLTGTIPEGIGNCTSFDVLNVGSCNYVGVLVLPSLGCYDANLPLYWACRDISYNSLNRQPPALHVLWMFYGCGCICFVWG